MNTFTLEHETGTALQEVMEQAKKYARYTPEARVAPHIIVSANELCDAQTNEPQGLRYNYMTGLVEELG